MELDETTESTGGDGLERRTGSGRAPRHRTWSVGGHLLAVTVTVVVFFGAVGAYSAWGELRQARRTVVREATSQAATVAKALASGWSQVGTAVATLAADPSVAAAFSSPSGCQNGPALEFMPGGHLDLVAPDGRVVCSSASLPARGVTQDAAVSRTALLAPGGPVQVGPFRDAVTGQRAVGVAAPVKDRSGRRIGAVIAVSPMAAMAGELAQAYAGPQHYRFAITDSPTGAVLSAPGGSTGSASGTPTRPDATKNPITSGGYLYGSALVPGAGWLVFAGVRPATALGPTRSVLVTEIILGGLALLVILALLALIHRRIATPLRRLTGLVGDTGPHVDAMLAQVGGTSEVVRLATAFREVTEGRDAYEAQLTHNTLHDPLTGLPNRALLADRLGHALAQAARSPGLVAVLFIDVDRFKLINDSLGHTVGDEALVILACRLANLVRDGDTLARFGGDEFVIVCEDLPDVAAVTQLADRLAESVAAPLEVADQLVRLTVSVGIAVADESSTGESLLRDADAAVYQAKRRGGSRYQIFDPQLRDATVSRLALETELRTAVERGELHLAYQPKVDLTTGLVDGIEALMRWDHPALGVIPPNTFIPIAEETGLIGPIGLFALDSACRQAGLWQDQGFPVAVSVNLSGRQLADPRLVGQIGAILDERGLPADRLCLELTESILMAESNRAPAALAALKELGLRLSIDDFGTGYSSLSYLQRFPVDELKIDRTFVHDLTDNTAARNLAAAIVAMGNALGLEVVAEGVETAVQAGELRRLGCRSAQGYLFARPGSPSAVTSIMRAGAVPPMLSSPP